MKKRKLPENQAVFVEARAKGINRNQSAIIAYGTMDNASRTEGLPAVQDELRRIRAETASNVKITKEEVVQMLVDAAGMAKLIGDPTGLVAAAREIGKMLGFYAPEAKKLMLGVDQATLKKALQEMNDEELYKLAHARTIDGTAERVDDPAKTV